MRYISIKNNLFYWSLLVIFFFFALSGCNYIGEDSNIVPPPARLILNIAYPTQTQGFSSLNGKIALTEIIPTTSPGGSRILLANISNNSAQHIFTIPDFFFGAINEKSFFVITRVLNSLSNLNISAETNSFINGDILIFKDNLEETNFAWNVLFDGTPLPEVQATRSQVKSVSVNFPTKKTPRPLIGFEVQTSSGLESQSIVEFNIILTRPAPTLTEKSAVPITVSFSVSGSATADGVDHTLANGEITITANTTSKKIVAAIVDDDIQEGDETIIINLSNPVNADLSSKIKHTYTIMPIDSNSDIGLRQCTEDSQCIIVKKDCCGCANGGSDFSINSKHLDYWQNNLSKECVCLTVYLCAEIMNSKCVNSFCEIVNR